MSLSAKAAVAGVAGWPVGHSLSPRLHGYWLDHYGIDGTYIPLPLRPEDFAEALPVLAKIGMRGLNVTLPHKEQAFRLCHRTSPRAQAVQAVNTIVFGPEGEIFGDNTDGYGFLENLRQGAPPGWSFRQGPAVVLGAGGAARGIVMALKEAGVPRIVLLNRTQARAETLAGEIPDGSVSVVAWDRVGEALAGASLVVNTTSLGMVGQPPLVLDLAALPKTALVTDCVYTPLETPLLAEARSQGLATVDGLGMLLHQARPGFAAWFGRDPEVNAAVRHFVLQAVG